MPSVTLSFIPGERVGGGGCKGGSPSAFLPFQILRRGLRYLFHISRDLGDAKASYSSGLAARCPELLLFPVPANTHTSRQTFPFLKQALGVSDLLAWRWRMPTAHSSFKNSFLLCLRSQHTRLLPEVQRFRFETLNRRKRRPLPNIGNYAASLFSPPDGLVFCLLLLT